MACGVRRVLSVSHAQMVRVFLARILPNVLLGGVAEELARMKLATLFDERVIAKVVNDLRHDIEMCTILFTSDPTINYDLRNRRS